MEAGTLPANGLPAATVRAAARRLAAGNAILSADLAREGRRALRAGASGGIRSLAGVRLQLGPQTGCLLVGDRRGGRFSATELVVLKAIARRAAIEHLRAVAQSGQRELGRALHDSFGQTLTSIVFGIQDLEAILETDRQRVLARELRAHACTALDQLRRVIDAAMAGGGRARARGLDLVALARQFAGSDVAVHVVNRLGREPVPGEIARCLRQVAREALLNVRRHANALDAGASGYLLKDASRDELVRAVRAVAADQSYFSPAIARVLAHRAIAKRGGVQLTPREREVVQLIGEGRRLRDIAGEMFLSPQTIKSHRANAMRKLGTRTTAELVRYAIRAGLTPA